MPSTTPPYATLNDAPKFEKRAGEVRAPWFKDPPAAKSVRVKDPLPYITCNSKTAPFATFHNVPKRTEDSSHVLTTPQCLWFELLKPSALLSEQQPRPTTNGSQSPQQKKLSTPYGTSNDVLQPRIKPNLAQVHQAPWDRSDRKLDRLSVQASAAKVHPAPWERNDVHHKVIKVIKVQSKSPYGEVASANAPFAMDFKQG